MFINYEAGRIEVKKNILTFESLKYADEKHHLRHSQNSSQKIKHSKYPDILSLSILLIISTMHGSIHTFHEIKIKFAHKITLIQSNKIEY